MGATGSSYRRKHALVHPSTLSDIRMTVINLAGETLCNTTVSASISGRELKVQLANLMPRFPASSQSIVLQNGMLLCNSDTILSCVDEKEVDAEDMVVTVVRLPCSVEAWMNSVQDLRTTKSDVAKLFKSADSDVQGCRDCVLEAVSCDGMLLGFVDEPFRADCRIALAAVHSCGEAIQFVQGSAKEDRSVVLAAVSRFGLALQYAPPLFQQDRSIVLAAVRQNPKAFRYASGAARHDCAIRCVLVRKCGENIAHGTRARCLRCCKPCVDNGNAIGRLLLAILTTIMFFLFLSLLARSLNQDRPS
eukprot:gnl/TRDRNA2_/TRDRNA2_174133_c0_seq1.p1 gnl/TRDRNA2_/TRDRNA2_174133_c0~~gnl/TRDRNA2_/TRDRNA2_174133_c0_seq1.p1  ORF type:complete len:305 (+),score=12.86 gnl/TRDRNA2_/TRDRNA2_174133_c0_seq1:68-982(+)